VSTGGRLLWPYACYRDAWRCNAQFMNRGYGIKAAHFNPVNPVNPVEKTSEHMAAVHEPELRIHGVAMLNY
jgi:hypothetical protein